MAEFIVSKEYHIIYLQKVIASTEEEAIQIYNEIAPDFNTLASGYLVDMTDEPKIFEEGDSTDFGYEFDNNYEDEITTLNE